MKEYEFALTSGGFDPIHIGHIQFLEWMKKFNLPVVVAVNNDSYVEEKHTCFQSVKDRVSTLNALQVVDQAFELPEGKSVGEILRELKPKVFVKGHEYAECLPEDELRACQDLGIQIAFSPTPKYSSSELLRRYKEKSNERDLEVLEANILGSVASLSSQSEYTSEYFFDNWRALGHSYEIETRRRIEGQHPRILKEIFGHLDSFLDIGCGNGALMLFLHELGLSVDGLDISEDAIANAPKEITNRISLKDLTQSTTPNNLYDLVICREVLEHIPFIHYQTFVNNICRHSRRYVYITTRFAQNPKTLWDLDTEFEVDPTHITLPTKALLRSMMALNGFKRVKLLEERIDWLKKGRVLVYERI